MSKENPFPDENSLWRRRRMVQTQMRERDIRDERVLAALEEVPRERFVPELQRHQAFEDQPLPIGGGQTISQPYIVALMVQELQVQPHHRVLDVGAGSGYQTAVLSRLARHVYAIERLSELADQAREVLRQLSEADAIARKTGDRRRFLNDENGASPRFSNVTIRLGDGTLGWPEEAPFDGIICGAAAPQIPPPWVEQLAEGGRIVAPIGGEDSQTLLVAQKIEGQLNRRYLCGVRFVKLIGEEGWGEG